MKLREFLAMYDSRTEVIDVFDNNLDIVVRDIPYAVLKNRNLAQMEVIAFGFCDNELYVKVRCNANAQA